MTSAGFATLQAQDTSVKFNVTIHSFKIIKNYSVQIYLVKNDFNYFINWNQ